MFTALLPKTFPSYLLSLETSADSAGVILPVYREPHQVGLTVQPLMQLDDMQIIDARFPKSRVSPPDFPGETCKLIYVEYPP